MPQPNTNPSNPPARKSLALPITLIIASVVAFIAGVAIISSAIFTLADAVVPDQRTTVPGSITVTPTSGTIYVFAESNALINGKPVAGPETIAGLTLRATDETGSTLRIDTDPAFSRYYETTDFTGQIIAAVPAPSGTPVTISATVDPSANNPGTPIIAAAPARGLGTFGDAALPLAAGAILVLLAGAATITGVVITVLRLAKRNTAPARDHH